MKNILKVLLFSLICGTSFSQMGDIWSVTSRQDYDVNENIEIIKTYEKQSVCQFFMFIDNNEFIHVTDNITSLYKIIKRDESKPNEPMYTVVSEAGNTYTYIFNKNTNAVYAYSTKGFMIEWLTFAPYKTEVFGNINR